VMNARFERDVERGSPRVDAIEGLSLCVGAPGAAVPPLVQHQTVGHNHRAHSRIG
jgi:hypothetical protein